MDFPRNYSFATTPISSRMQLRQAIVHFRAHVSRERDLKPRFAEFNTIEHTIGLKWKQLELQEKQLIEEAKRRTQFAAEQLQAEVDQMVLEHHAQALREGRKAETRDVCRFVNIVELVFESILSESFSQKYVQVHFRCVVRSVCQRNSIVPLMIT